MLPSPAPEKASWISVLITIGAGILLAIASFVLITSQWSRPTSSLATVGFFGILFGILIFAIGCIWLIVKIAVVVSRSAVQEPSGCPPRPRRAMKEQNAIEQVMAHTSGELTCLSPQEREQLQTGVLKQFGLPPLTTLRIWAREAAIFALFGALGVALAARSLMAGLAYGSVMGVGIWIVYRLFRFALT